MYLYHKEVQQRCIAIGLITPEKIRRNNIKFKPICIPGYILYVLLCVYAVNGARGFAAGFWQLLAILSVMNLVDRFAVDEWWVGHTRVWTIFGTEDLKSYITVRDRCVKWIFGTLGMAVISAALAGIMTLFI